MNTYLLSLGWWNFVGSVLMLGLLNPSFGKKVMNESTKIFQTEFELNFWSRFWLGWAIGLNIFFGLINIYAAKWDFVPLKQFLIIADLVAYTTSIGLAFWGIAAKRTGSGIWSVLFIFSGWIGWGIWALTHP